ncbi:serine hydroxymethyltransferase 2 isoform 1, partial [Tanacetum coccineum]
MGANKDNNDSIKDGCYDKLGKKFENFTVIQMEKRAVLFMPKLVVVGASAYARVYDYARMCKVCDKQIAIMLADMAHISGLVTVGVIPSPLEYVDVVMYDFEDKTNQAVFSGLLGGPQNHTIIGLAVALKQF